MTIPYTNNFKGRSNRTEKAKHLRDEFEAIEAGFILLNAKRTSTFTTIYTNTISNETTYEIDPANGTMQEITLTQTTVLSVKNPASATSPRGVSLLIHGTTIKVINNWGPQTWKEGGSSNWIQLLTGPGQYASMLIDFTWDGKAWIGIVSSKAEIVSGATSATFPLIKDLSNVAGTETLVFSRSSSAIIFDTNEKLWHIPAGQPRFSGSRFAHNWVAEPDNLQGISWIEDNAVVSTEAAAGPSGGDTDKITFSTTGGNLSCFVLPAFGRPSTTADTIKFLVRFKAKMFSGTSGSFRVAVTLMNAAGGGRSVYPAVHDVITVNLDDTWRDYGYAFDFITGGDTASMDLTQVKRTLVSLVIISPSGSVGAPVLVEGVQIEPIRDGYPEIPSELQNTTIGASITLAKTAGSTGAWDNGTKIMTMDNDEFVDFQDSLEIGKTYLMVCTVTSGFSADVLFDNDRTYWQAYTASDNKFVKQAPFTFRYEGGAVTWKLTNGVSGAYVVNIYLCSNNFTVYDTEIGNTLNASTHVLTDATGAPVSSRLAEGLAVESSAVANIIPFSQFRAFYNWTIVGMTSLSDPSGKISSFQGEYGIEGLPFRGTLLQDTRTTATGYITETFAIPADTNEYTFSWFTRRVFDISGNRIIWPEYDGVRTQASKYLDIVCRLKDGAGNTIGGDRARIALVNGQVRPDSIVDVTEYSSILGVNYQDWWKHAISLTNDGTMTEFEVTIAPAAGDSNTQNPVSDATLTGWVIIDWAGLELENGTHIASSAVVGGETRAAESLTSGLGDGDLYNSLSDVIGDITAGAVTFDAADTIVKNVLYQTGSAIAFSADNMHEFGPPDTACSETLDDDAGNPIFDAGGNAICTGSPPSATYPLDGESITITDQSSGGSVEAWIQFHSDSSTTGENSAIDDWIIGGDPTTHTIKNTAVTETINQGTGDPAAVFTGHPSPVSLSVDRKFDLYISGPGPGNINYVTNEFDVEIYQGGVLKSTTAITLVCETDSLS